jgi:hypothetical protein
MSELRKYPRMAHIEGSSRHSDDLGSVPFATLADQRLVVTEKLDGANAAVSFAEDGALLLQSRGHFLTGGPRELQFAPLKAWASRNRNELWERLGDRHVLYGEWLYAKHTIFYDALPHHFLGFDVLDRDSGFLSALERRALLAGVVASAPVLHEGPVGSLDELVAMVGPSRFKTPGWRERLDAAAAERGLDVARVRAQTDSTDLAEGLVVEADGERYKWVRGSFVAAVEASGSHWHERPILPNRVAA